MKKVVAAAVIAAVGIGALAGCAPNTDDERKEYQQRKELNRSYDPATSLELKNLKEKRDREDDPDSIRYLYLMNFGQVVGYYVTVGKVSSNGSQVAPTTEFVNPYSNSTEYLPVESAQDDGSYGDSESGIFFFTTDGVMVVTSLDYIQSDSPLPIDVPRLGG